MSKECGLTYFITERVFVQSMNIFEVVYQHRLFPDFFIMDDESLLHPLSDDSYENSFFLVKDRTWSWSERVSHTKWMILIYISISIVLGFTSLQT